MVVEVEVEVEVVDVDVGSGGEFGTEFWYGSEGHDAPKLEPYDRAIVASIDVTVKCRREQDVLQ
jgi:hypothetical protein